jgi:hypothetical protein
MRVSTAFNKILGIVGAPVVAVTFTPAGIVVGLRRRRTKLVCPCGWKTRAVDDRSTRRWRHLDSGRVEAVVGDRGRPPAVPALPAGAC